MDFGAEPHPLVIAIAAMGKSPFLISKSTINRPFSIAMLVYWKVCGMKPAQKTCAISRFCLKLVC